MKKDSNFDYHTNDRFRIFGLVKVVYPKFFEK